MSSIDFLLAVPKPKAALLVLVNSSLGMYLVGSGTNSLSFGTLSVLFAVPIPNAGVALRTLSSLSVVS